MSNGANSILVEIGAYSLTLNIRKEFPEVK